MSVRLFVCLSHFRGGVAEGDGEGGQKGEGQWGGGISMMEYQSGHTFPMQRWVTPLVLCKESCLTEFLDHMTNMTFTYRNIHNPHVML